MTGERNVRGWRRVLVGAAAALAALVAIAAPAAAAGVGTASLVQAVSAGTYVVAAGSTHVGDISLAVGTVVVRGVERGSVHVGAGEVEVSGRVTGDVKIGMGQIVMTHGARVGGRIQVGAGQQTRLPAGTALPQAGASTSIHMSANVMSILSHNLLGGHGLTGLPSGVPWTGLGAALGVLGRLSWWLLSLAVAFVILAMFPAPTRAISTDIENAWAPALGWGLLVALAAGPAAVLLAVTILGIPLALLLGLLLLAAKVMGYVAVALILGSRALPVFGARGVSVGWELVAGSVLLLLVGSVPVLGLLVDVAVGLLGIGACGRTGFGTGRPWFRRPAKPDPA